MYRQVVIASFLSSVASRLFCTQPTEISARFLRVQKARRPFSGGWTFRQSPIRILFCLLMNI